MIKTKYFFLNLSQHKIKAKSEKEISNNLTSKQNYTFFNIKRHCHYHPRHCIPFIEIKTSKYANIQCLTYVILAAESNMVCVLHLNKFFFPLPSYNIEISPVGKANK